MAFIDLMRERGFAVESVCHFLREQGVQVAARTYRAWKQPGRPVAARTITDAAVIDALRTARIVGWHAMVMRPAELVLLPLRMAAWARGQDGHPVVRGELVHHSDAGSQYTAIHFTEHLQLQGITPSVGSVGDALENALMESIIGLYKTECVRPGPFHPGPLKTLSDVEFATMAWVEWYNHRRLHTTLGMRAPAEHEAAHYAALQPEPQPV